ncbi:Aste57867_8305 [Aphanomyces stellatus]|uniref:Aste57867_8305 protein n=1 Tax=Aphanomyces stellatus TaxID=120398 RepID=A0A485KJW2_9STRA|nr:hypothetical protein As57867_008274 [Aphanomyces stellatus]VFT85192.1 Aste57867_8305 [Aphanomyces stellatus]
MMKHKDSRKQQRQNERQEKKKVKHRRVIENNLQRRVNNSHDASSLLNRNKRGLESASGNSSKRSKKTIQNKFMEMIDEQAKEGVISFDTPTLKAKGVKTQLKAEDVMLKKLEMNLGIGKANGKTRLNKEFEKDGLGEDFGDFLSSLDDLSKKIHVDSTSDGTDSNSDFDASDDEMDEDMKSEMEMLAEEDSTFIQGFDDLPTDDENEDDDLNQFLSDEDEDEDGHKDTSNNMMNEESPSSEENHEDSEGIVIKNAFHVEDDKFAQEIDDDMKSVGEDIYGRPVFPTAKSSRYIPPHMRKSASTNEELLRELRRRVNGQLNRLSESNMESIAIEFESIYRLNVRADVNRVLLEALLSICCHETQVMTQLITISSALLAALFHSVGTELVGFFVENFMQRFHQHVTTDHDAECSNDNQRVSKEAANLLLLITNLYSFETVHCTLVYDMFRFLTERFTSTDIELLHILLQHCGPSLRADDPTALFDMISIIQAKSTQIEEKRVRFLLDLISNLKKSKSKAKVNSSISSERFLQLRKWIGRVKTRVNHSNNPLRVTMSELLAADAQGRWWIIGGTWVPPSHNSNVEKEVRQQSSLLRLAEKQRMNTDVRRSIFCAIMGASDSIEAFDAVAKLELKDKQEREVIRVLLHCCGQETKYNPYYSLLATKFASSEPRFKFTLQLSYWDAFKQMAEWKPRKVYNLACLLASLLESGSMTLSCLKVLDFTDLSPSCVLFLKVVFERILLINDDNTVVDVFERISLQKSKMTATRDGIAVFLHQHMMSTTFKDPKVKLRMKRITKLLDCMGKSK